jgi:hypothetical protein
MLNLSSPVAMYVSVVYAAVEAAADFQQFMMHLTACDVMLYQQVK